jgi:hypothetical protein
MSWLNYMFGVGFFEPTDNAGRVGRENGQGMREGGVFLPAITTAEQQGKDFYDSYKCADIKERVNRNSKRKPRGYSTPQAKSRQTKYLRRLANGEVLTNGYANKLCDGVGERELREAVRWLRLNGVDVKKTKQHGSRIENKYLTIANQKKAQKLLGEKVDVSC